MTFLAKDFSPSDDLTIGELPPGAFGEAYHDGLGGAVAVWRRRQNGEERNMRPLSCNRADAFGVLRGDGACCDHSADWPERSPQRSAPLVSLRMSVACLSSIPARHTIHAFPLFRRQHTARSTNDSGHPTAEWFGVWGKRPSSLRKKTATTYTFAEDILAHLPQATRFIGDIEVGPPSTRRESTSPRRKEYLKKIRGL